MTYHIVVFCGRCTKVSWHTDVRSRVVLRTKSCHGCGQMFSRRWGYRWAEMTNVAFQQGGFIEDFQTRGMRAVLLHDGTEGNPRDHANVAGGARWMSRQARGQNTIRPHSDVIGVARISRR